MGNGRHFRMKGRSILALLSYASENSWSTGMVSESNFIFLLSTPKVEKSKSSTSRFFTPYTDLRVAWHQLKSNNPIGHWRRSAVTGHRIGQAITAAFVWQPYSQTGMILWSGGTTWSQDADRNWPDWNMRWTEIALLVSANLVVVVSSNGVRRGVIAQWPVFPELIVPKVGWAWNFEPTCGWQYS